MTPSPPTYEEAIWEWMKNGPENPGFPTLYFLRELPGSRAVLPLRPGAAERRYVSHTAAAPCARRVYDFTLAETRTIDKGTGGANAAAALALREWGEWVRRQEEARRYPDFAGVSGASGAEVLSVEVLDGPPEPDQMHDTTARFSLRARLTYIVKGEG